MFIYNQCIFLDHVNGPENSIFYNSSNKVQGMDLTKISQSTTDSCQSPNPYTMLVTIPKPDSLEESMPLMTRQQINLNLLQLNLVSLNNEQIFDRLCAWSRETKFYLQNRYLLEKLISTHSKSTPKQRSVKEVVEKYDTMYVNGCIDKETSHDLQIIEHGFTKQVRAEFISRLEEFPTILDELSTELKKKQKTLAPEELATYFSEELKKINNSEVHAIVSPNKLELSKLASQEELKQQKQKEEISSDSYDSPRKKQKRIFTILYKNAIHHVNEISIEGSTFITTKNRCPLVLDFGFKRFIFKNDNQLAHELISMHLIKYINKIVCSSSKSGAQQPIVEYEIIPQAQGAFYQFVEDSLTVNQIKLKFKGGIPEYISYLEEQAYQNSQVKLSSVRKRFAETFAGFCLAQYLLDLKDRNNSNIMIKSDGSIFHIDLAFIFNATPGGFGFENCPFKFTKQYLEAMGGFESDCFKYYETLMIAGMTKLCINRQQFLMKLSILSARKQEILCFKKFKVDNYKSKIPKKPHNVKDLVQKLIGDSYDSWRTKKYDDYQFNTNRILP